MTCPALACVSPVPALLPFCSPHWWALTQEMRDEVWRTWKAHQRADGTSRMEAARAWLRAREAAVKALGELEGREVPA